MIDVKVLKDHMYDVISAIHEVHCELGSGINEFCYQEGLELELQERNIAYSREAPFHPTYHGRAMQASFRVDFICKQDIVVECKAVLELTNEHRA